MAGFILVLALAASTYAYAATRDGDKPARFAGTDMGGSPAPGFALTDQHGEQVTLADQRGKVTVLTFLYTHCPDVCPLTAAQLRLVDEQLGADADHVALLAISVDPEQDTVAAAYEFSARFGLEQRWSYLVGSREDLEPLWDAYFVGVAADSEVAPHDDGAHQGAQPDDERLLHNAPVFLIDHEGNLQAVHTTGSDPSSITDALLRDISVLIDEIPERTRSLPTTQPGGASDA